MRTTLHRAPLILSLVLSLVLGFLALAGMAPCAHAQSDRIAAVVNGDAITRQDIDARGRLFALSTGMPLTPDVLARLRPQILRQLIDEKLRLQAILRAKIVVPDTAIAQAIAGIEQRNNMPPGALQARLAAQGVTMRTLIDEVRVQIGWLRFIRQKLGDRAKVTPAEISDQIRLDRAQDGKPQYHVAEIFIAVDQPSHAAEADRFASTVIDELRQGAPFAVVAAQFSQSQDALEGGDMGWVRQNQLDPAVAQIADQMPDGAISDPIRVAGGYLIVSMLGKRTAGRQMGTVLSLRQAFVPFTTELNPNAPTPQQQQALAKAEDISKTVHSCDAMEAENTALGNKKPSDPGPIVLENVSPPAFRTVLGALQPDQTSRPLIARDGIAVVILCSRDEKNLAALSREQVGNRILDQRAELASRALLRELQRQAMIDQRGV
jgi:peptidyl-prolyl cis-trans isomerase SurA